MDVSKPGPKPRPAEEVRGVTVTFKVTPPSKEKWECASRLLGVSRNEFANRYLDKAADSIIRKKKK